MDIDGNGCEKEGTRFYVQPLKFTEGLAPPPFDKPTYVDWGRKKHGESNWDFATRMAKEKGPMGVFLGHATLGLRNEKERDARG